MEAACDAGVWWLLEAQALAGESNATVWSDAGLGADAPEVRPPRATRRWAHDGAVFFSRQVPGGLRGGPDLAVFFVAVVVEAEFFDEAVGLREGGDVFGGEEGGETFLPEVVRALDFSFGLRGGREAQGDLVKAQGGAELGEGVWLAGEEKGVVVDIEGQG
jgi:hypothetical protein